MPEDTALGVEERAELERLRAEVATLRSQVQRRGGPASRPVAGAARQRWRTIVASLCIVVACVLAPLSVVAVWTRNQVTNTGPVGTWVEANKRALRITAIAAAALALVFWGRPTGKVVLGLTLALLFALALIGFLGRPAPRAGAVSTHT